MSSPTSCPAPLTEDFSVSPVDFAPVVVRLAGLSAESMKAACSRLLAAATHLAGHQGPLDSWPHFFEDVLLEPEPSATSSPDGDLFQIEPSSVQEILEVTGLVAASQDCPTCATCLNRNSRAATLERVKKSSERRNRSGPP